MSKTAIESTDAPHIDLGFPIVAVGASAGGLEALERLFSHVDPRSQICFVVIQHLSPDHKSMMGDLLSRHTPIPIRVIEDGCRPEPRSIWLIPPKVTVRLAKGVFRLDPKPPAPVLTMPIDIFLTSLAKARYEFMAAIVLSGTGTDGTKGVRSIREAGGLVIVQSPGSARFDGMPRNAIASNSVDLIAPPEEIAERLESLVNLGFAHVDVPIGEKTSAGEALRRVIRIVSDEAGVNFALYKPSTIGRRIARRMAVNQVRDTNDYLVLIQSSESERESLYRDLLIGVTEFFRDKQVWSNVEERVIADLVASTPPGGALRMWVAGCSTGEEAYTLAMLVHEQQEKQQRLLDVKIFATDVDRHAIDKASRGLFPESLIADVSPELRAKHFTHRGDSYEASTSLRKMILFAQQNLTRDPPFTKLDLITCRNVLIYFEPPLQEKVVSSFHFGLRDGGYLLLGASESIGSNGSRFETVDQKHRIFRAYGPHTLVPWTDESDPRQSPKAEDWRDRRQPRMEKPNPVSVATNALVEQYVPAAILIDDSFRILHVFGDAGRYLKLTSGTPDLRILEMAAPGLASVLTSGVPHAIRTQEQVVFGSIPVGSDDERMRVRLIPFRDIQMSAAHALVVFEAEAVPTDLSSVLEVDEQVAARLLELSRELQHSRDSQQSLVEELETSNEEMQATNQELLASNEELQATNEELQSVNEELHTVNAEFQQKIQLLQLVSSDLDHLLNATDIGTLFLDGDLKVRKFTPTVIDFFPIMDRDIGRPIEHLTNQLGGADFIADIRAVKETHIARERTIDSASGPILVRVMPYMSREIDGVIVTLTNVSEVKRTYELARTVLDSLPAQVAFVGMDGTIRMVNKAWEDFAIANGADPTRSGIGINYFSVCGEEGQARELADGLRAVLDGDTQVFRMEYPCHAPDDERWFVVTCLPMTNGNAVVVHFDVTPQKRAESALSDMATHDYLTGLINRRGLDEQLAALRDVYVRTGEPLSALVLDVDNFKGINDSFGLATGDIVLTALSRRIESSLRPIDVLSRVGGDEFVVLLPGARTVEAGIIAERIRLAVSSRPIAISGSSMELTVSIAVVTLDDSVKTLENLLDVSRYALKATKSSGKNRVAQAAPGGETGLIDLVQREIAILLADPHSIGMAAQPIVRMSDGTRLGYELLCRPLKNPDLSPEMLFQQAAQNGSLAELDRKCLNLGLQAVRDIGGSLTFHLNLYPSTLLQLNESEIVSMFADFAPGQICIELSEQQIIGEPTYLLPKISRLRELGVTFALDDVGFGRTALESLIILEPEVIKIDRTYVHGVSEDQRRQRWLRRLTHSASALKAEVIAEGVERPEDADAIRDMGINEVQGFLYGRPQLVKDMKEPVPV